MGALGSRSTTCRRPVNIDPSRSTSLPSFLRAHVMISLGRLRKFEGSTFNLSIFLFSVFFCKKKEKSAEVIIFLVVEKKMIFVDHKKESNKWNLIVSRAHSASVLQKNCEENHTGGDPPRLSNFKINKISCADGPILFLQPSTVCNPQMFCSFPKKILIVLPLFPVVGHCPNRSQKTFLLLSPPTPVLKQKKVVSPSLQSFSLPSQMLPTKCM